ncbi:hypothetical protein MT997_26750 [Paenibacillus sp. OVF10]|nr:hypothetical protein MT997_26750 [Paenibacillus sp. OVF10]
MKKGEEPSLKEGRARGFKLQAGLFVVTACFCKRIPIRRKVEFIAMRKLISLALILVLVLSFNVAAYADGDVTQAKPLTKEEIINSKEFREAVKAAKAEFELQKADNAGGPVLFAPAPNVSHINVYGVVSPNGGQEIYGFNNNPSPRPMIMVGLGFRVLLSRSVMTAVTTAHSPAIQ